VICAQEHAVAQQQELAIGVSGRRERFPIANVVIRSNVHRIAGRLGNDVAAHELTRAVAGLLRDAMSSEPAANFVRGRELEPLIVRLAKIDSAARNGRGCQF
jgi:hypothetical protein